MTHEELESIEAQKQEAKLAIAKSDAFKRMRETDDYKLVIKEGYLTEYPRELAEAIANNTGKYDTDKLVELLRGTNGFIGYTFKIAANGQAGVQTIQGLDALIAEDGED